MNAETRDLAALIRDHVARLDRIRLSIDAALSDDIPKLGKTSTSALIIAGLLENYYTCVETAFLRISQFFENILDPSRWRSDLLEKMTLRIEGVRPEVVSRDNFSPLFELLKFRHFKRYYFDLEYDWDRLDFLILQLRKAHPTALRDFDHFVAFLDET